MRVPTFVIAAVMLSAANVTPLHAQSDEEIILADPAFSLTFAAGYIASDLNLWAKHGIKVKTVAITGIGAISLAGSKLPCNTISGPAILLAICGVMHQSIPNALVPVSAIDSRLSHAPFAKTIVGALSFIASMICRMYGKEYSSKSPGLNRPAHESKTWTASAPASICFFK